MADQSLIGTLRAYDPIFRGDYALDVPRQDPNPLVNLFRQLFYAASMQKPGMTIAGMPQMPSQIPVPTAARFSPTEKDLLNQVLSGQTTRGLTGLGGGGIPVLHGGPERQTPLDLEKLAQATWRRWPMEGQNVLGPPSDVLPPQAHGMSFPTESHPTDASNAAGRLFELLNMALAKRGVSFKK